MSFRDNKDKDPRINRILELVHSLAAGDLDARCPVSQVGDELDAIIGGLNMLAEELQASSMEKEQARMNLEAEKEKLRFLIEQIPFGIISLDAKGNHHFVNKKFIDLFGYSLQEIPDGKTWLQKAFPNGTHRNRILSFWIEYVRNPETKYLQPRVFNARCKDGTIREVLTSVIKLDENNLLAVYEDVTEKRMLEQKLVQAQKMEAIGTLAGGVAHDLNNILSGIVSYPDLLLMDLPDDSPMRNAILTIRQSGKKAAAIVQDLLTLARRGVSINQVLNLNKIVDEYTRSPEYQKLLSFHPNVEIEFRLAEDLLNIKGSSVHLSKMLMNLTSNAFEATMNKGKVIISTENRYVDMQKGLHHDLVEGEYVVLAVADEGIGISNEDLKNIYEPFYTKKIMGRSGTGLGMSVVWGTVKDHRGYIDTKSSEGHGTTFEIYIPATRSKTEDVFKPKLEEYTGNGETILIVDDVEQQRTIASNMLFRLNYTVDTVPSGEQAIEYLREKTVDLVILDMIMPPGMDGLDTYLAIKKIHPDLKVIIASGFSETDRVKKAMRLGVREYIKKPYSMETIGMAVKKERESTHKSAPP
ncbi:MAG: response regulator [Deltaproteobacteria bacterium]|nr:response regulator [Deltaproteobacteria bacterium]